MVLLIDNYDSFVHNLARYVRRLGFPTEVIRNDAVTIEEIQQRQPQAILISPGPCTPDEAGISIPVVQQLGHQIPILGICLGHQAIVAAYGGQIIRAEEPVHGRVGMVEHKGHPLFAGLPSPFAAGRYHSLIADRTTLPQELDVLATLADGTIMAIAHREAPVIGLQFHPESVLTDVGHPLLENFFRSDVSVQS